MAALTCAVCDTRVNSTKALTDHLWSAHFNTDEDKQAETRCSGCEFPVSKKAVSYHYSCIAEIEGSETDWLHTEIEGLCPLCGDPFETQNRLDSHLRSHTPLERQELLGGRSVCQYCSSSFSENGASHVHCLLSTEPPAHHEDGRLPCPGCSFASDDRDAVLWHCWSEHFQATGTETACPGCDQTIAFGRLRDHLDCLPSVPQREALRFIPNQVTDCFICDLSAFNPQALATHVYNEHLSELGQTAGACPACDEKLPRKGDKALYRHYPCIAEAAGTGLPIAPTRPRWSCPSCYSRVGSATELEDHIASEHFSEMTDHRACVVCGDDLQHLRNHRSCLRTLATSPNPGTPDSASSPPPTLDYTHRFGHTALTTVEAPGQFFDQLQEFVSIERAEEEAEAWDRYNTISVEDLARKGQAIPGVVCIGKQYHPDFSYQYCFEFPVEEDQEPPELTDEFDIYPRMEVILDTPEQTDALPIEGIVTFVDGPSIGVAAKWDTGKANTQAQAELGRDTTFDIYSLINPKPYDREQSAIRNVRKDDRWREVILGERQPAERPYEIGEWAANELNEYQRRAVGRALGTEDVFCIHGPPGTGKTRTLTAIIRLAVARGDRVLACAHSNQAIDNLLVGGSTLEEPDETSLHYHATEAEEFEMSRVGNHTRNRVVIEEYSPVYHQNASVVGATTSAAADLDIGSFDLVVVDEATQASQPSTFIPLLRGDRLVLAGDHKQLPPYCSNETAKDEEMHVSLFEHLLEVYGERLTTTLRRQYRMNEAIAEFPNQAFYDDRLAHGEANSDWTLGELKPFVGLDVTGEEQTHSESHSKHNTDEAQQVANQVKLLLIHGVAPSDIGIITAYRAQIGAIRSALSEHDIEGARRIKIDTIDSFQGSEREAIIVSFVRSNSGNHSGFLTFPEEGRRRLNVAITRARKRCVLIGDWNTLGSFASGRTASDSCADVYADLYTYLSTNGWMKEVRTAQA